MRSRIRSLLLLLLLGAVLLEGLLWARVALFNALHRGAYPEVGLDDQGQVVCFDDESLRPGGFWARDLDTARMPPEALRSRHLPLRFRRFRPFAMHLDFDSPRFLVRDLYARLVQAPPAPLDFLATQLNHFEESRRGIPHVIRGEGPVVVAGEPERAPVLWGVEDGRLVCRAAGSVVAGFGPDGYARGEGAAEGARFGNVDGPFVSQPKAEGRAEWLLLDWESRAIHAISLPRPQPAEKDSADALSLSIEARPFRPLRAGESETETMPYLKVAGREVLAFLRDGSVIFEIEMEPGERLASSFGAMLVRSEGLWGRYEPPPKARLGDIGIDTTLGPFAPDTERRRLRLFAPGEAEIVRDVVLEPTRAGEILLANLAAACALLRPPPLALASALSPLPSDRIAEPWWWRDPWLAGGRYSGWLALSLALAAFCAWRARRSARERCATVRGVRLWTVAVFLLGPLGLLWMRLVLPRVPVEAVGGARRAVNLDASPSTSASWPEPKPLGIEVFS